jgi:hypothetical protein
MPPVTLSTVVDLAKIKMKWKEQYVSEGLNKKIVPFAAGIYHGLKLTQNISGPRLVDISVGSDTKHAAVYESATGFSLTYFDVAGASVTLDLSDASLDNQETVITLSISYAIGVDTTANWIAYPIADWNALTDAQRAERIVLGTVNVPAPATNITTAMITPDRRTVAWEGAAPGEVPWSPILRNPSFEHGITAAGTSTYAISDWYNNVGVASNGSLRLGATTVRSGAKSLEFFKSSAAATSAEIQQFCEIPVVPGQLVKLSGWIRQLIAPTGFSEYNILLSWGNLDSVQTGYTSIPVHVVGATDATFRNFQKTLEVAAGNYVLKSVIIQGDSVTAASGGVAAVFDDIQVYVEAGSPTAISAASNDRLKQQTVSAVLFEHADNGYDVGELAALLRYDRNTPVGEGSLIGERKDQATGDSQPALSWYGRLINIGARMLFGSAESALPRIGIPFSVNDQFTLLMESAPEAPGLKVIRVYTGDLDNGTPTQPGILFTVNARFNGTDWVKDVNGVEATGLYLCANSTNKNFLRWLLQESGTNTWATSAWPTDVSLYTNGNYLSLNLARDIGGVLYGTVEAQKLYMNPSASTLVTDQMFAINVGYQRRGPVWSYDGDIDGVMIMDPHGSWVRNQRFWEEDFNQQSLGRAQRLDVVNVGTSSASGGGNASLTTNAAINSITTLVQDCSSGTWGTDGGLYSLGFRMRVVAFDVTSAEMYIGFWAPGVANPDNNASLAGAFKIVNGTVSFVHNGVSVVATGVTVTAGEARWFSAHFDPVNGVIQWHISANGGVVGAGYTGGAYGEVNPGDMEAGDPARPTVGIKTTTAATASCQVDYMSAWKGNRSAS